MKKKCRTCKIEKELKEFYSAAGGGGKYGVRGTCKSCVRNRQASPESKAIRRAYTKSRPMAMKIKYKDYQQKYRGLHKDEPELKAYKRKWYLDNIVERRDKAREKNYGISGEQYRKLLSEQNGVCKICLKAEVMKNKHGKTFSLAVDHNHETGKVRGLLCMNCNQGIGKFQDSSVLLQRALDYKISYE